MNLDLIEEAYNEITAAVDAFNDLRRRVDRLEKDTKCTDRLDALEGDVSFIQKRINENEVRHMKNFRCLSELAKAGHDRSRPKPEPGQVWRNLRSGFDVRLVEGSRAGKFWHGEIVHRPRKESVAPTSKDWYGIDLSGEEWVLVEEEKKVECDEQSTQPEPKAGQVWMTQDGLRSVMVLDEAEWKAGMPYNVTLVADSGTEVGQVLPMTFPRDHGWTYVCDGAVPASEVKP